jgi:hypothetical protein
VIVVTIKWSEVVEIAKREAYGYYNTNNIPLTLRGLFYILVSKNVIPNTKNAYITLSKNLAEARYFGKFPWHLLHDKVRDIWWGDIGYTITDAQRVVEELSKLTPEDKEKMLKEYLKSKYNVRLVQWEGQPHRVMIAVEKDALYDIVKNIVRYQLGWDVSITFSRGFESASQAKDIAGWIKSMKNRDITPVLLLVYDFDPSGEYASIRDFIFRVLALTKPKEVVKALFEEWEEADDERRERLLEALGKEVGVKWEKVMLTWDQVVKYNIPPTPENEEVKKKLERDPRKKWFVERYGNLYQAEVDALIALNIDEAKRILDEAIRKYFDAKIYEEVKKKEEELRKQVEEKLGG